MDIDDHGPQEGLEGIRQHVTCMEHGRCLKCGVGRGLLRNKELKFYNELAGQRWLALCYWRHTCIDS